eukprot:7450883-Alexandrium_andersonii.AAC.1
MVGAFAADARPVWRWLSTMSLSTASKIRLSTSWSTTASERRQIGSKTVQSMGTANPHSPLGTRAPTSGTLMLVKPSIRASPRPYPPRTAHGKTTGPGPPSLPSSSPPKGRTQNPPTLTLPPPHPRPLESPHSTPRPNPAGA